MGAGGGSEALVEAHGDHAEQRHAGRGDADTVVIDLDDAVGSEVGKGFEFGGESEARVDTEFGGEATEIEATFAHQTHNDGAAGAILIGQTQAALKRKTILGEGGVVFIEALDVLPVGVGRGGNRGQAETVEGGAGAGAVALEISLERAGAQGVGEFVVGPGEVVETDVDVTGGGEALVGEGEEGEAGLGSGKLVTLLEDALSGADPGNVGVAEDGEAVGAELKGVIKGAAEGLRSLKREAVDQVEVDRANAGGAEQLDGGAIEPVGLETVNRELDAGVGVLNTEGGAVDAERGERVELVGLEVAGVDFDTDFGVGGRNGTGAAAGWRDGRAGRR